MATLPEQYPDYHQKAEISFRNELKTAAVEHGRRLHPADREGTVTLVTHLDGTRREKPYSIAQLADILPALAGEPSVYLSAQRFHHWRKIVLLKELSACYSDLDFYRVPALAGMRPMAVLDDVLAHLRKSSIPEPNLVVNSGRGLYLFWLVDPVPRAALPRWNAIQNVLFEVLKPFGADPMARDATRVLRVPGTLNEKSQSHVETIPIGGKAWSFDDLAGEVLPMTREELADLRVRQAAKASKSPARQIYTPHGFTEATLWEGRLTDLQTLRRLRWFGPLPDGHRDPWVFVGSVALTWFTYPPNIQGEITYLVREAGVPWGDGKTKSKMHSVLRSVKQYERGQTVSYAGYEFDPRFRFRNQTLLDWFEITPEEECQMKTIISAEEERRRDRERTQERRREAGMMPRDEYLSITATNRREAHRLRSEGHTVPEIVEKLGVSTRTVYYYFSGGAKSVPLYGAPRPQGKSGTG